MVASVVGEPFSFTMAKPVELSLIGERVSKVILVSCAWLDGHSEEGVIPYVAREDVEKL